MQPYPFVSFCVVTFNHETYIYQALQSIINTRFDFEFEIIVGNDKSTDATNNEIERFVQDNPRVNVCNINRTENVGFMHNYLDILSRGNGDFFLCLDGDDYLEVQGEELSFRNLLINTEGSLLFSHRILYSDNGRIEALGVKNITLGEALDGVFFHISSIFIAKKNIDLLLSYDWLDKFNFLDRLVQLDVARDNKNRFISNVSLSVYRKHSSSLSTGMSPIFVLNKVTDFIIKYYGFHKQQMTASEKRIFYKRISANYSLMKHPFHIGNISSFFKSFKNDFPQLRKSTSFSFSCWILMRTTGNYIFKRIYRGLFKHRLHELPAEDSIVVVNE